ncbi:MAG: CheR family methyltransferase [Deltaproteobacteria bacterium]
MAFTFFFRDQTPLEHAVSFMTKAASGRSKISIWDAGCAMGQEPYTLAIILAETMNYFALNNIKIYATDYDEPLLKILQEGCYPWDELQRIPPNLFEKYFQPDQKKGYFRLIDKIKSLVEPQLHNLLSLTPIKSGLSLIVCKNVLLHFNQAERISVIRMFHKALEVGGIFVTEHTQKMPEELSSLFEQLVSDGQVFRKVEAQ